MCYLLCENIGHILIDQAVIKTSKYGQPLVAHYSKEFGQVFIYMVLGGGRGSRSC